MPQLGFPEEVSATPVAARAFAFTPARAAWALLLWSFFGSNTIARVKKDERNELSPSPTQLGLRLHLFHPHLILTINMGAFPVVKIQCLSI